MCDLHIGLKINAVLPGALGQLLRHIFTVPLLHGAGNFLLEGALLKKRFLDRPFQPVCVVSLIQIDQIVSDIGAEFVHGRDRASENILDAQTYDKVACQLRNDILLDRIDRNIKFRGLARLGRVAVILRESELQRHCLSDFVADQPALKAVDESAGSDLQVIAGITPAVKFLSVDPADIINIGDVALFDGVPSVHLLKFSPSFSLFIDLIVDVLVRHFRDRRNFNRQKRVVVREFYVIRRVDPGEISCRVVLPFQLSRHFRRSVLCRRSSGRLRYRFRVSVASAACHHKDHDRSRHCSKNSFLHKHSAFLFLWSSFFHYAPHSAQ